MQNMKKYVILTSSISNMGGAQMYIRNKILYLREHGWNAMVIAGRADNVIIHELREFKKINIPEIDYCSFFYSIKKQEQVLEKLNTLIADKEYDKIVIESTSTEVSTWAESIAQKIGAQHLIFLLQEHNSLVNKGMQDFYIFKYLRRELASITKKSLAAMFKDFHPIEAEASYHLQAYSNNVEADIPNDLVDSIDKSKYDYIIGALSRLDKPFVPYAVEDLCNYAHKHSNKQFLLLWIGDAPKGSPEQTTVKAMVGKLPNVKLIITGYLLPIPIKLLELCDAFISSAGSCWVCKRAGIPTISYDGNDYKPIGILGWTTNNSLFRAQNEPPQNLTSLLDDVIIKKKYPKSQPDYLSGIPDFQSHMDFIDNMDQKQAYYDITKIQPESWSEKKIRYGLLLLGPKSYFKLHNIKKQIKNL